MLCGMSVLAAVRIVLLGPATWGSVPALLLLSAHRIGAALKSLLDGAALLVAVLKVHCFLDDVS